MQAAGDALENSQLEELVQYNTAQAAVMFMQRMMLKLLEARAQARADNDLLQAEADIAETWKNLS